MAFESIGADALAGDGGEWENTKPLQTTQQRTE